VSDVISGGLSGHLGPLHLTLGSLKFLLETRLQSESFDTSDNLAWWGSWIKSYDLK